MQIEIVELQAFFFELKQEKIRLLDRTDKKKVQDILLAEIGLFTTILIWLDKTNKDRSIDMEKLKLALTEKMVSLEELPGRQRHSEVEEGIMELVKEIKPGKAISVDSSKISFGNFYSRVTKMKKSGKLPDSVVVRKRGKEFYVGKTA